MLNPSTSTTTAPSFVYRKTKPFTRAELKFKTALADYAGKPLLSKLQQRNCVAPAYNRYTGVNARVTDQAVYLEAILVNDIEWGGFSFDFARLIPTNGALYNVSVRREEDWVTAEQSIIASAANYFVNSSICPRASDWILLARGKTFEQCVKIIEGHIVIEDTAIDELDLR